MISSNGTKRFFLMQINSDFPYDQVPYGPYSRGKSVVKDLPNGIRRGDLVVTYFGEKSPEYKQQIGMVFEVVRRERQDTAVRLRPYCRFIPPFCRKEILEMKEKGTLSAPFSKCGIKGFNMSEIKSADYRVLLRGCANKGGRAPIERRREDQASLRKIRKIQGALMRKTVRTIKYRRSRELVDELKRLYHHRCQLCSPRSPEIPLIPVTSKIDYVEVHHIRGFRETLDNVGHGQEDGKYVIDRYKNIVVLCCYHHKLLHKYHGGFRYKSNQEAFVSHDGRMQLRLKTNKHL